ncbi:uncharacterized protein LTR77_002949 [Saxophila tyrrhenica]|uniref:Uncharacterized protein n=1 Tax=Saxophila tyrrhenica TaxID=1690608 RepID=A0AAV9PG30_9PEZI|nr:hypothetical protein LTR77_002949 [Saxophila tyrrhenica]
MLFSFLHTALLLASLGGHYCEAQGFKYDRMGKRSVAEPQHHARDTAAQNTTENLASLASDSRPLPALPIGFRFLPVIATSGLRLMRSLAQREPAETPNIATAGTTPDDLGFLSLSQQLQVQIDNLGDEALSVTQHITNPVLTTPQNVRITIQLDSRHPDWQLLAGVVGGGDVTRGRDEIGGLLRDTFARYILHAQLGQQAVYRVVGQSELLDNAAISSGEGLNLFTVTIVNFF